MTDSNFIYYFDLWSDVSNKLCFRSIILVNLSIRFDFLTGRVVRKVKRFFYMSNVAQCHSIPTHMSGHRVDILASITHNET